MTSEPTTSRVLGRAVLRQRARDTPSETPSAVPQTSCTTGWRSIRVQHTTTTLHKHYRLEWHGGRLAMAAPLSGPGLLGHVSRQPRRWRPSTSCPSSPHFVSTRNTGGAARWPAGPFQTGRRRRCRRWGRAATPLRCRATRRTPTGTRQSAGAHAVGGRARSRRVTEAGSTADASAWTAQSGAGRTANARRRCGGCPERRWPGPAPPIRCGGRVGAHGAGQLPVDPTRAVVRLRASLPPSPSAFGGGWRHSSTPPPSAPASKAAPGAHRRGSAPSCGGDPGAAAAGSAALTRRAGGSRSSRCRPPGQQQ